MKNNLLKSLLVLAITLLINSFSAKADVFWTESDGDWDDPNIWNSAFSGSNVVPGNNDDITIRNVVTLTGNRTLAAGGKITVGGLLGSGVLTADNITNFGEILIYGNGKLFFNQINNNASAELDNFGKLIGTKILNAAAGDIHNRPSGTLLLSDGLVNGGSFENKVNAVFNAQSISNFSGDIENEGLIRSDFLVNDMGGVISNFQRMEIAVIHNGANETASTNGGGVITNAAGSTIIISDHMDNYSGRFNNHGLIEVENYWHNYDRFRVGVTGTLLIKRNATNFASGPSGVGILQLYGIIRMGKFAVLHLDAIPPTSWDKYFVNEGNIEGNGQGGIYAKEENTFVTNAGDITIGGQEVFLCIGTPADYTNSGTGDFTQDCCFLLTADAGPDQTFCWNVLPYAPIGGSPTASMGVHPYSYGWNPPNFLTNASGANGGANPPAEQIYTINITDANGCTASDQVTITPETTDPIAFAGDDIVSCPGELVTLGGTPAGTCGTGGLTYQWNRVPSIFSLSNAENPQVSPTNTTTYRLRVTDGNNTTAEDFITVFVNSDVIAYAGPDATACGASYTMQANIASGQTGTWTTVGFVPPSFSIPDVNNPNVTVLGIPIGGNVTLQWEVDNGTCTDTNQVTITGGSITQATVANTNVTFCVAGYPHTETLDGNSTNLGETGHWNILSTNAAEINIANTGSPFSAIEFTKDGVYELKWTITDGNCTTESVLKTITVKQKTIVTSGMAATCASIGGNPNMTINAAGFLGGAAGTWSYDMPSTGAADSFAFGSAANIENNTLVINNITGLPLNLIVTWSVNQNGCTHEYRIPIRISEQPVATVTTPSETLCSNLNAALVHTLDGNQPQVGETGTWSVFSGNAAITPGDENKYNAELTINTSSLPEVVEVRWVINNGSCSKIVAKTITVNESMTTSGPAITDCVNLNDTPIILLSDMPGLNVGETGLWTFTHISGMADSFDFGNNTQPNTEFKVYNITTTPYKGTLTWTISKVGTCDQKAEQAIAIYQSPTANAGVDDTATGTTYNMQADALGGSETGLWAVITNIGGVTTGDLTDPNMQISSSNPASSITMTWTVTNSATSCSTTSTEVTISGPACGVTQAIVTDDEVTHCVGTGDFPNLVALDGNLPAGGETGEWTIDSSVGSAIAITNIANPTSDIEFTGPGTYNLVWTITDGSCSTVATKKIIVIQTENGISGAPAVCSNQGDDITINMDISAFKGGAAGSWGAITKINGNAATWVVEDTNSPISNFNITNITALPLSFSVVWEVNESGCISTSIYQIIINENPVANAGSDDSASGTTYNMQADALGANETGLWSIISQSEIGIAFDDLTNPTMQISNLLPTSVVKLTWTVTNSVTSCNTTSAEITITGASCGALTTATVADPIKTNCNENFPYTQLLDGNAPVIGETGEWKIEASSTATVTFTDENNPTTLMQVLTPGMLDLTWTITDGGGCFSTATKQIEVIQTTFTALGIQKGCEQIGDNYTIGIAAAGFLGGAPGSWDYTITNGSADNFTFTNSVNTNTNIFNVSNITALPLHIDLKWTVNHDGCISIYKIPIQINEPPTVSPGLNATICSDTYILQGTLDANEIGKWTQTGGTAVTMGDDTDPSMVISNLTAGEIITMNWTVTDTITTCTNDKKVDITTQATVPAVDLPTMERCAAGTDELFDLGTAVPALTGTETGQWVYILTSGTADLAFSSGINDIPNSQFKIANTTVYPVVVELTWRVSDIAACDKEYAKKITLNEEPFANPGVAQTIDCTNTEATIGTGAAQVGYSYLWTTATGNITGATNTITTTVDQAGTYTLKVTNNTGGCFDTNDVIVTNTAALPVADAGVDKTIDCANLLVTIGTTNAPLANHTYKWTTLDGNFVGVDNQINVAVNQAGTYTLTVTNTTTSCISLPADITVTNIATLPIADAGTDKTIDCTNTAVIIGTAVAPLANHTYKWTTLDGNFVGVDNQINVAVNQAGTYTLTVTNTTTSCISLPVSMAVTDGTTLPIANAGTDQEINCTNPTVTIGTGTAQVGYSYLWTTTTGNIMGAANGITATVDQAGTYTLKVTNDATTCFATDDVDVTADIALPIVDAGTAQEINCTNPTVTIGTGTAQVGYSYLWTTTTGNITGAANSITTTADQAGTYTLTVTNDATTCFGTDDVIVTEDIALPIADAGLDQFLCNDLNTILSATLPSGSTGLWEIVNGTVNIVNAPVPNTEINSLLPNTTVTLRWTEDNGCGTDSKTITITNNTAPTTSNAGPDQTLCDGTTSATLDGNAPLSGSGVWTVVSGPAILSDEFLTNSSISGLTDGSVSVLKWTISNGICPISESEVTIKVLEPKAIEKTEFQICDGESVQLLAKGGISYAWSPSEGLDAVDIPNPVATPSIPTTYTVIINSGGSCGSTTKEVKVDVIANPMVTITEDATINIGESIDLLATGGTGYSWTPAEGLDNASIANPVATPTKNTTYNVTVSNIEGCDTEASVTIDVKEDFQIFVPQMFEPNSSTNNVVKVNTIGIKNVVFKIYNRTNAEIFSTTDSSIGWDGKYNGTVQNMDTYVYVVIAETYAGTKITRQGSIQLVR